MMLRSYLRRLGAWFTVAATLAAAPAMAFTASDTASFTVAADASGGVPMDQNLPTTTLSVKLHLWQNGAWVDCASCKLKVYRTDKNQLHGQYTASATGNVSVPSVITDRAYALLAGTAAQDHSCDQDGEWQGTWLASMDWQVRVANQTSIKLWVRERPGIGGDRYIGYVGYPPEAESLAYGTIPAGKAFGVENMLDRAGHTQVFTFCGNAGDYSVFNVSTAQITGSHTLWSLDIVNRFEPSRSALSYMVDALFFTYNPYGYSRLAWTLLSCANLHEGATPDGDGYPAASRSTFLEKCKNLAGVVVPCPALRPLPCPGCQVGRGSESFEVP